MATPKKKGKKKHGLPQGIDEFAGVLVHIDLTGRSEDEVRKVEAFIKKFGGQYVAMGKAFPNPLPPPRKE